MGMTYPDLSKLVLALMSYPYSIKEKKPTLVCSDQDMSYPYSIKEKEPTLVCSPVLALSP
jgi:hypothetical protein